MWDAFEGRKGAEEQKRKQEKTIRELQQPEDDHSRPAVNASTTALNIQSIKQKQTRIGVVTSNPAPHLASVKWGAGWSPGGHLVTRVYCLRHLRESVWRVVLDVSAGQSCLPKSLLHIH